jgi:hypothetical protein
MYGFPFMAKEIVYQVETIISGEWRRMPKASIRSGTGKSCKKKGAVVNIRKFAALAHL